MKNTGTRDKKLTHEKLKKAIFSLILLFFMISALKYSRELEEKALADEDLEQVKCPSEGFHDQEKADQEELSEEDDEKKPDIPEYVKFLKETIQHCRHFISFVGCPQWQLLAMQIVGEAILKIKMQQ